MDQFKACIALPKLTPYILKVSYFVHCRFSNHNILPKNPKYFLAAVNQRFEMVQVSCGEKNLEDYRAKTSNSRPRRDDGQFVTPRQPSQSFCPKRFGRKGTQKSVETAKEWYLAATVAARSSCTQLQSVAVFYLQALLSQVIQKRRASNFSCGRFLLQFASHWNINFTSPKRQITEIYRKYSNMLNIS